MIIYQTGAKLTKVTFSVLMLVLFVDAMQDVPVDHRKTRRARRRNRKQDIRTNNRQPKRRRKRPKDIVFKKAREVHKEAIGPKRTLTDLTEQPIYGPRSQQCGLYITRAILKVCGEDELPALADFKNCSEQICAKKVSNLLADMEHKELTEECRALVSPQRSGWDYEVIQKYLDNNCHTVSLKIVSHAHEDRTARVLQDHCDDEEAFNRLEGHNEIVAFLVHESSPGNMHWYGYILLNDYWVRMDNKFEPKLISRRNGRTPSASITKELRKVMRDQQSHNTIIAVRQTF